MNLPAGLQPRHAVGIVGLLVVSGLMAGGVIDADTGLPILIAILGSVGLYEGGRRMERRG